MFYSFQSSGFYVKFYVEFNSKYFILFLKVFLCITKIKVFIEFVTILLLFCVLFFWSCGMGDLSFLTRDQTHIGNRNEN